MKPLLFTWPHALLFWGVFLWAYLPESRIIRRARREATAADAKSLHVITYGGGFSFLLAFVLAFVPALQLPRAWLLPAFLTGVLLVFLASLLRRHCFRMLATSFTGDVRAHKDQEVVTTGAYRYVRHPSYTAGIMLNFGVGLALGSWVSALLLLVSAIIVYIVRMNVEEKVLLDTIGEPYARFMRTRKRLVPYLY